MRLLASVTDLEVGGSDNRKLEHICRSRVDHHGGVHARERAPLQE
jgi:hypothetical protein